jgi:transposase-like protein
VDHYARAFSVFSRIRGYRRYLDMLHSLRRYDKSEVAQERMRIIKFYDTYGEQATKEAFGADSTLIHVWKKKLRDEGGRLEALVPESTRPLRSRQMRTDPPGSGVHPPDEEEAPEDGQGEAEVFP